MVVVAAFVLMEDDGGALAGRQGFDGCPDTADAFLIEQGVFGGLDVVGRGAPGLLGGEVVNAGEAAVGADPFEGAIDRNAVEPSAEFGTWRIRGAGQVDAEENVLGDLFGHFAVTHDAVDEGHQPVLVAGEKYCQIIDLPSLHPEHAEDIVGIKRRVHVDAETCRGGERVTKNLLLWGDRR